jgi:Ca-activated chloride channel family protein
MDDFVQRIRHASLSSIEIDFGDMDVHDVSPRRLPDLFVGRPVVLTGRFVGSGEAVIHVRGRVGTEPLEIPISVDLEQVENGQRALPKVWARSQIADLADRLTYDRDPELPDRIRQLALDHGLMSSFTAFVAVDSSRTTEGDHGVSVNVPVPVPDGVRYDTPSDGE